MKEAEIIQARQTAARQLKQAGIVITPGEEAAIEIADFGLGEFSKTGLALVVYVNNERYCAKELIMLPRQICPEHRHPPAKNNPGNPGKQETFRVRQGSVFLYVPGSECPGKAGVGDGRAFTVFHRVTLSAGEQYTLAADTLHWFQAGKEGAIISEFSSASDDASDIFTDSRIRRVS